jgi:hypothetical protein
MMAVIIVPNAMPRWPDQMTSDQITELNNSVNKRYRRVARFGVSRIPCGAPWPIFMNTNIDGEGSPLVNRVMLRKAKRSIDPW